MALTDLTTESVNKAIEEFHYLGRDAFLQKYGFGSARGYVLERDGNFYDSKAIVGAAHGYLPGHHALTADQFSGGATTVQKVLESLGFTIQPPVLPSPGDVLSNNEISQQFVVGNMGGMRRSSTRTLLVLISDPFKGLYQDRWEGDVLHYTGMGPPDSLLRRSNLYLINEPALMSQADRRPQSVGRRPRKRAGGDPRRQSPPTVFEDDF